MFVSSLIHWRIMKTYNFLEGKVLRENHVNRESNCIELTIYLYRCYEHESPRSCNTTVYLSVLIYNIYASDQVSQTIFISG